MSAVATGFHLPSEMSLRDKIAQLIYVRVGSNLPPICTVEQDEERVARLLDACPVGGLLLFNGGLETKKSLERLQQASKLPLLVGSDIERGVGQQVKGYTLFPHAMALGRQRGSIGFLVEAAVREARDVGIHITFAPVADVNTNPLNPIISIRAFSDDAELAAGHTAYYVKLAEASGLLTTAKHFPGHGDTHQDSHDSMPSVGRTLDELRARELLPFQAAIDAGCSLIMTAHVAFPNADSSGLPATLSPFLLQRLLRTEMGFQGVICSDSLLMSGVRDRFAIEGEMALATLNAGVDLLLDLREPAVVVDYLVACVRTGALSEDRVNEAFARAVGLKHKVFERPSVDLQLPINMPSTMSLDRLFAQTAASAAREAIEVLHGGRSALPLDSNKPLTVILLKPFETPIDPPEQPLAAALRDLFRDVKYAQLGPKANAAAYQTAGDLARSAAQLVVAVIVRPAAWHDFKLRPEQKAFVHQLIRERDDVVLASLGVPYVLQDYPEAAVCICAYSDVPVSQQALAAFLQGGTPSSRSGVGM